MSMTKTETKQITSRVTRTRYAGTLDDQIADLEAQKKSAGNKEMLQTIDRAIDGVKRMGRKPKPAALLRDLKCTVRFNRSEFDLISNAFQGAEFAAAVRELALEAARVRTQK